MLENTTTPAAATATANTVAADTRAQQSARRVLQDEIAGLTALANSIDAPFSAAVASFAASTGKVVCTGIGKSGHIARKIAATMASTGTPAIFVHPSEASHGDLGMITRGDRVLALSNSGNSHELGDIIAYTRRFNIPLIAITKNTDSLLGEQADIVLELPTHQEACPLGLAPTTSTTMALALGDALAVALLERSQFTGEDFHSFHPGGALGKRLPKVADLMLPVSQVPAVTKETPVPELVLAMTSRSYGCAVVLNGGNRLLGLVTDGDLRRHMTKVGTLTGRTADLMTIQPRTITPNSLAAEAVALMNDNRITSLLVVEEQRLVGLIHLHDCLRQGVA